MYEMKFWFEHGGGCLWSKNEKARIKYGYPIDNELLPISQGILKALDALEKEYRTILDWDEPQNPLLWSLEEKQDFIQKATAVCFKLQEELGAEYEIENDIISCVYLYENTSVLQNTLKA